MTLGGLYGGLTEKDIMNGVPGHRNANLGNILFRLNLIEAYGTGIPRIIKSYDYVKIKPQFEITPNSFKLTLPNRNYNANKSAAQKKDASHKTKKSTALQEAEQAVLALFKTREYITRNDVEKALSISTTTAKKYLRDLVKCGVINVEGRSYKTRYVLKDRQR